MSKLDPARGWQFAMKLLAEEELERIDKMSDAELDEAMREQGLDPEAPQDVEPLLAKIPAAPAPVVDLATRRRGRPVVWLAAAAVVAAAASVFAVLKGPDLLVWWRGPTLPIAQIDAAPEPPAALVRAEALRDEAERACSQSLWGACQQRLDDAMALDPGGEGQPRVLRMRGAIAAARPDLAPGPEQRPPMEPFRDSKPPLRRR
jgi:hypothetical protein